MAQHTSSTLAGPLRWIVALLLAPLLATVGFVGEARAAECPDLLRYTFKSLQSGETENLCRYQGNVILIVNTASFCGYTDQYAGLEALYRKYKGDGLVVLGFPANDFGNQEPGSNKEIASFCRLTYGVEFPMFEKTHVVGPQRNRLYEQLHKRTGAAPSWNFHKYLIDPSGEHVLSFGSNVAPDDRRLVDEVRKMLDARKKLRRTT